MILKKNTNNYALGSKKMTVIDLGEGNSFNVSAYTDIYNELSLSNFYVEPISGSWSSSGMYAGSSRNTYVSSSISLNKSYESTTGVLTAYISGSTSNHSDQKYLGGASGTVSVHAYLIY